MSFAIRMSKGQSRYGNLLVAYILILRKRKAETKKIRYMATGNIGVTTANIFPVIKKFLYSDHEIFLREIVSNAVDATSKLKTLASVKKQGSSAYGYYIQSGIYDSWTTGNVR